MNPKKIKKLISPFIKIKYRIRNSKGWLFIGNHVHIKNQKNLYFEKGVNISPFCLLIGGSRISFGKNVYIGYYSEIMCAHNIEIGDNTICGPFMFVTDSNHEYRDPDKPISEQGAPLSEKDNSLIIGADSWIGAHVTIVGNVRIGKHCIIGANSLANSDIPDYSVAVGSPAKRIKTYNRRVGLWERT